MLASIVANTKTLVDLKGLFAKYFKNTNSSGDGNGSISISGMETQGDIQARSMELDTGRVRKISLFHDLEIFIESTSKRDWATEEALPKSHE